MNPQLATPRFTGLLAPFDLRTTALLRTDVLVIGSGIAGASTALAAADEGAEVLLVTKDDLFATNLRAFFLTAQRAAPFMKKRGGAIINFSSITIHISPPDMSAYVATKGGILGFTRALARELGPHRIRVNTLSPGWIMTDRQLDQFVTPAIKKKLRDVQCIPDLLQPSEIANVALFLASDASSAITGQEILADRGWAHS